MGMTRDSATQLTVHSDVYALGDKYNMPDLKDSAKMKFLFFAGLTSDWSCLSDVAANVYSSTPESDRALRDILVQACKAELRSLLALSAWQQVMDQHEDLKHDLLSAAATKMNDDHEELERLRRKLNILTEIMVRGQKIADVNNDDNPAGLRPSLTFTGQELHYKDSEHTFDPLASSR